SFFSRIASAAAHAGQSQYLAPAALISFPWASICFAFSAPNTLAPASDPAKAIRPSTGIMSLSSSAISFFVCSASWSVPAAFSQFSQAVFASAQQEGALISSFTFSLTYSLTLCSIIRILSSYILIYQQALFQAPCPSPPAADIFPGVP